MAIQTFHLQPKWSAQVTSCGLPWPGVQPLEQGNAARLCPACAEAQLPRAPMSPLAPQRGPLGQAFYVLGVAAGRFLGRFTR